MLAKLAALRKFPHISSAMSNPHLFAVAVAAISQTASATKLNNMGAQIHDNSEEIILGQVSRGMTDAEHRARN